MQLDVAICMSCGIFGYSVIHENISVIYVIHENILVIYIQVKNIQLNTREISTRLNL